MTNENQKETNESYRKGYDRIFKTPIVKPTKKGKCNDTQG